MEDIISDFLFNLIRIAIGKQSSLSEVYNHIDWNKVYHAANKQSIIGVCFSAISKLPENDRPYGDLFFQWLSVALQIQNQNKHIDEQSSQIWHQLIDAGLEAVVLKGQGIATLYGDLANLRQSGDIDIWVKGGYQKVCKYVHSTQPTDDLAYHRFHYDTFEDTEVELHHRPTLMRNLLADKKLSKWYNSFDFNKFTYLEEKGFAVPSYEFNSIFVLTHIYRHFLFAGVGLRQVMDYYFVLKNRPDAITDNTEIENILGTLRLKRFAGALMWVLKTQFLLEKEYLICNPNKKEGRFLLNEIMKSGNFGQLDERYRYKRMFKLKRMIRRGCHLLIHYPSEVLWSPIWIVYHFFWKLIKKNLLI